MAGFLLAASLLLAGCGDETGEAAASAVGEEAAANAAGEEATANAAGEEASAGVAGEEALADAGEEAGGKGKVASAEDMAAQKDVEEEGMEPVSGDQLKDGTYEVTVDSSSSMFQVEACTLTVEEGEITAVMTMGGTGYLYLYMGTGEEAAAAGEADYIPFVATESGKHTYTVPVEALDKGISCAAFSRRKEMWYDRVLLFRADSLPAEAFAAQEAVTAESLGLKDREYTVEVALTGGSGRASVESPAVLVVEDGQAWAYIVWSSSAYDYMKVDGVQYDPVNEELGLPDHSAFRIPVSAFDCKIPVKADTTAMSTPHEIDYTLQFDSSSIKGER